MGVSESKKIKSVIVGVYMKLDGVFLDINDMIRLGMEKVSLNSNLFPITEYEFIFEEDENLYENITSKIIEDAYKIAKENNYKVDDIIFYISRVVNEPFIITNNENLLEALTYKDVCPYFMIKFSTINPLPRLDNKSHKNDNVEDFILKTFGNLQPVSGKDIIKSEDIDDIDEFINQNPDSIFSFVNGEYFIMWENYEDGNKIIDMQRLYYKENDVNKTTPYVNLSTIGANIYTRSVDKQGTIGRVVKLDNIVQFCNQHSENIIKFREIQRDEKFVYNTTDVILDVYEVDDTFCNVDNTDIYITRAIRILIDRNEWNNKLSESDICNLLSSKRKRKRKDEQKITKDKGRRKRK